MTKKFVNLIFLFYLCKNLIIMDGTDGLVYGLNQINSALTNAANTYLAVKTHKKDRAFAREMYQRQLEDNRENWAIMNEYNSPSSQRERLRAAGLNENLVYGSGGVVGTTSLPQSSSGNVSYSQPPRFSDLGQAAFTQYLQLRNYEKNLELLSAQTEDVRAAADLKRAQTSNYGIQNQLLQIEQYVEDNIKEYRITQAHNRTGILENELGVSNMYSYEMADKTLAKLIAEVAVLSVQHDLSRAQIAAVYKDIEVKNATITKLMADTGLTEAQASNIYDLITSRAVHDNIDIQKFIMMPYGQSKLGMAVNAFDNLDRALDGIQGNDNYPSLSRTVERIKNITRGSMRYPVRHRVGSGIR